MTQIADLEPIACALADAARTAILPHFRKHDLKTENKESTGFDPVTVADRAAEEAMRAVLAEARPKDAILGEEFAPQSGNTGLTWVLDPIDGTRGFISGTPTWGVLIAVTDDTGPVLGVIDQPYIGERFVGHSGSAYVNGPLGRDPLGARRTTSLADATIFTTFPELGTEAEAQAFANVAAKCKLVRYGCDCYAYALLAAGQIDLVIEAGLNSYDICAPIALIEAAGGRVTNWEGAPVHEGGRALAAATPELHTAAQEVLQSTLALAS